jgi:excisionase family DNA binding protein
VRELSEHLRVHPTTIYRLLRRGLIPGFRVGNIWRFRRAAIETWERGEGGLQAVLEASRAPKRK